MRAALAIGTLLLLLARAGDAGARQPPVAFSDCLPPPEVRPMEILLACGDGTESFTISRWTRWNRKSARALGTAEINDCTPSCADGHVRHYRGVVLLDRPRGCGGQALFTRLRLVLANRAGSSRPMGTIVMCHH
jgi:hypothetical protein